VVAMSRLAVCVKGVDIDFEVFTDRRASLKARLLDRNAAGKSVVKAVRGVSLDVYEGETVGVIGLNGSGKSTLLAAIAGVLPTTKGEILVSDEPRLMGVGSALIGEASGIRNIRLGCLALGMPKAEVEERLDDFVAFTELGDAIHRPLNTYSSGMRARVQFVVATAVAPRILLIDEALSVGDKDFRQKSRNRVEEIIHGAGTLFMVNHSLDELRNFCTRGIWLHEGQLVMDGPIADVISAYQST
jgi:teichoic acid transport system ATP-binding protein